MEKYIDIVVEKTKETVEFITKKTDEFIDISKQKIKKATLESELKDVYQKLGRVVYDAKKSDEDEKVLISLIVSEIDAIKKSIEEIDIAEKATKYKEKYTSAGYENVKDDNHDVKVQPVETVDFIPTTDNADVPDIASTDDIL